MYWTSAEGGVEWSDSRAIYITASEVDPAHIRRKAVWGSQGRFGSSSNGNKFLSTSQTTDFLTWLPSKNINHEKV